jgi:hypothetical protein
MNSIEGLVPCTVDSSGRFGSLTSSRLWSSNCHPTTILPPFAHNRSIRGLPPTRLQANAAASLASTSLLGLGLLPKADHGWREAHGLHFWFTRDYSATLPSQWSNKSLVAISSSFFPWRPLPCPSCLYPPYRLTSLTPNRRCRLPRASPHL